MGNGFTGPPAVDFYSMLSGLGDTIKANRDAQAKKDAFAAALTPGADGKVDYGQAMLGLAQADPQAAALFASAQNHQDTIKQQAIESARNAANDTFNHTIASANLKIAQATLANNSEGPEEVAQQRAAAASTYGIKPGTPEYTQYVLNGTLPDAQTAGKPIPYETLSGTKFLVRQPNGSYAQVDPQTVGQQPQPGAPQPAQVPPPVIAPGPAGPTGAPVVQPQPSILPQAGGPPAGPPIAAPSSPVAVPAGGPPVTPVATAPPAVPAAPATPQGDLTAVDPQTGRRENWLKAQSPEVQDYIKKVADYQIDPRTSSTKGGHREQIMSAVAQYDPTYDQNTFGSRAKAIKDFSTGAQGNSIRSFDVATDHLDTLQKYVAALKNGDVPLFNSIRNKWEQETGSSLPTNVQAVAPIVGAEVSKAIIGSNNALADREELRQPLQTARSPEQLSGAIEAYKSLMTGQLKGLKKQYEDTTGRKDFDSRIRPTTKSVLLGDQNAQGATASQPNVTSSGIKWSVQ